MTDSLTGGGPASTGGGGGGGGIDVGGSTSDETVEDTVKGTEGHGIDDVTDGTGRQPARRLTPTVRSRGGHSSTGRRPRKTDSRCISSE